MNIVRERGNERKEMGEKKKKKMRMREKGKKWGSAVVVRRDGF